MDWNTIFWIVAIVCFVVTVAIVIGKIIKSCNQKPIPYPQEMQAERIRLYRTELSDSARKKRAEQLQIDLMDGKGYQDAERI